MSAPQMVRLINVAPAPPIRRRPRTVGDAGEERGWEYPEVGLPHALRSREATAVAMIPKSTRDSW